MSMAFPEDVLRIPLGLRQVEQLTAVMPHRLPPEREHKLGADPIASNNYSKVLFGGGKLPEDMHRQMLAAGIADPTSTPVKDYFSRLP